MVSYSSFSGLGMQKDSMVRKGSSRQYSFFRKLIPQKMKENLKSNYFWQAE